jgi:RNA polymerase sigma-70 factor (ECF subfamily)
MDNLEELITKVRNGDQAAFAGIVALCEAKVRVVAASILHNREAVADVAQEAFVTAYTKLGQYEYGTNFSAWISSIARNLALNQRTRYMRKQAFVKDYQTQVDELILPAVESISKSMAQEAFPALRQCVEELGSPAQDVVRKFYFNSCSTRDISQGFGRPEAWARLILHRARALLGACMKKKGVLTGDFQAV